MAAPPHQEPRHRRLAVHNRRRTGETEEAVPRSRVLGGAVLKEISKDAAHCCSDQ
jgi:hypothetical protein